MDSFSILRSRSHTAIQLHDMNNTGHLHLIFDFNSEILDQQKQDWVMQQFLRVLDSFSEDLFLPIEEIKLLDREETKPDNYEILFRAKDKVPGKIDCGILRKSSSNHSQPSCS